MKLWEVGERILREKHCVGVDCDECPFYVSGFGSVACPFSLTRCAERGGTQKAYDLILKLKLEDNQVKKITAKIKTIKEITGCGYITNFGTTDLKYIEEINELAKSGKEFVFEVDSEGFWILKATDVPCYSFRLIWLKDIKDIKEVKDELTHTLSNGVVVSDATVLGLLRDAGTEK